MVELQRRPNASGLFDNAASEGGTNNVMFAMGTSGTVPIVVGNTALVTNGVMDGIGFATTGDGGINNDYRIYPASGTIVPSGNAAYSAPTLLSTDTFYQNLFPPVSAPAIQQSIATAEYGSDAANTQAGSTQAGVFGFAWRKVVLTKLNNDITWDINDTRIATYDFNAISLGGANIALGVSDVNTTTTRHPDLLFTVFDNLVVTDFVPEPNSTVVAIMGLGAMASRRQRRDGAQRQNWGARQFSGGMTDCQFRPLS